MSMLYKIRWHFAHASLFERVTYGTAISMFGGIGLYIGGIMAGNHIDRFIRFTSDYAINTFQDMIKPDVPVQMAQIEGTNIFIRMPVPRPNIEEDSNKDRFNVAAEPETRSATGPNIAPEEEPLIPVLGGEPIEPPVKPEGEIVTAGINLPALNHVEAELAIGNGVVVYDELVQIARHLQRRDRRIPGVLQEMGLIRSAGNGMLNWSEQRLACVFSNQIDTMRSSPAYPDVPRHLRQTADYMASLGRPRNCR